MPIIFENITFGNDGGFLIAGTVPPPPSGSQIFDTFGTYSWTAPEGVTSVCVVCVGAGGGYGGTSGGGGGLGWKNNIPVVPGQSYTVVVGREGRTNTGGNGGNSYFISNTFVSGRGGLSNGTGGTYVGDGGGNGGNGAFDLNFGYYGGGGGAGGYSGTGGQGGTRFGYNTSGTPGTGGAAGGGASTAGGISTSGNGGGTGILGQGTNGVGGVYPGGTGGDGSKFFYNSGTYGGGAGKWWNDGNTAGGGAVRIAWGPNVSYPTSLIAPVSNFSSNVTSGAPPLAVTFSDTSVGTPTSWLWDFKNNGANTSTQQNPSYTYAEPGMYPVKLTTTNSLGTNTLVKPNYITVIGPNYASLILDGLGTNGAQNNTFLNSVGGEGAIEITRPVTATNNTTQGSFTPFNQPSGYWSNYFDGQDDRLTLPSSSLFNITTSTTPFTIEGWIYPTAVGGCIFSEQHPGGSNTIAITISMTNGTDVGNISGKTVAFGWYTGSAWVTAAMALSEVSLNAWTHVACVFTGSTSKIYYNGVDVTKPTLPTPAATWGITNTNGDSWYVGAVWSGSGGFTGNISNFRFVRGTAVYTSEFTPSATPLTAITNTSLLTCQSNRFIDNSGNNLTITPGANTQITLFQPFMVNPEKYNSSTMGGSIYFDGDRDYLITSSSDKLAFGTGDYTIEFWIYSFAANRTVCGFLNGQDNIEYNGDTGILTYRTSGSVAASNSSGVRTYNSWTHLAIVRSSGTVRGYINGVNVLTQSNTPNTTVARTLTLGDGGGSSLGAYISNLRVVKGTAVYTANFTPPTSPVTAISGTSLLLNGTNAGIVDSTGFNDLETIGNAQISTAQSKWGGSSILFDGSGDYLTQLTNINYGYGTGDFTIECWLYFNSVTSNQTILSNLTSSSSINPHIYLSSNSTIRYYTNNADRIIGSSLSINTWYHIAISRSSGSTRLFVDGVQSGSTYTDSNDYGKSAPLGVGTYYSAGSPVTTLTFNGYMQGVRITKGIARYTGNFTPPTNY